MTGLSDFIWLLLSIWFIPIILQTSMGEFRDKLETLKYSLDEIDLKISNEEISPPLTSLRKE